MNQEATEETKFVRGAWYIVYPYSTVIGNRSIAKVRKYIRQDPLNVGEGHFENEFYKRIEHIALSYVEGPFEDSSEFISPLLAEHIDMCFPHMNKTPDWESFLRRKYGSGNVSTSTIPTEQRRNANNWHEDTWIPLEGKYNADYYQHYPAEYKPKPLSPREERTRVIQEIKNRVACEWNGYTGDSSGFRMNLSSNRIEILALRYVRVLDGKVTEEIINLYSDKLDLWSGEHFGW